MSFKHVISQLVLNYFLSVQPKQSYVYGCYFQLIVCFFCRLVHGGVGAVQEVW